MSGFVRKVGKAKTFSNLVVQLTKIFFLKLLLQTHPINQYADCKYTTNKQNYLWIVCAASILNKALQQSVMRAHI